LAKQCLRLSLGHYFAWRPTRFAVPPIRKDTLARLVPGGFPAWTPQPILPVSTHSTPALSARRYRRNEELMSERVEPVLGEGDEMVSIFCILKHIYNVCRSVYREIGDGTSI
jgi:hypothetical protein